MHPTVKPVALVADAILDCSKRRGIVLDAFAGSGTTLVAAERTGRRGYGIELDPAYCDTILKRVSGVAGVEARLLATGQTFAEVAAERLGEAALCMVRLGGLIMSAEDDDKVGYCRPPKHSRFKPGQSGNPRGRPRKNRSIEAMIKRELDQTVVSRKVAARYA